MKTSGLFAAMAAAFMMAAPMAADATPKHCPPGHAKKGWCTPGERYDRQVRRDHDDDRYYDRRDDDYYDRDYIIIRDYDRYGLEDPRDGYYYGVRNDEVYLIQRATNEIIEGLGAVQYLLNR